MSATGLPFDSRVSVGEIAEKPWLAQQTITELYRRLRSAEQSKDSAQHFTLADDATIQSYPSSRSGYMMVRFVDDDGTDIKVRMPKPVHATLCEMLGSAEQASRPIPDEIKARFDAALEDYAPGMPNPLWNALRDVQIALNAAN